MALSLDIFSVIDNQCVTMRNNLSVRSLLCLVIVANVFGCGSAGYGSNEKIVRRMEGVRHVGTFVSPFCYEWFSRAELFVARGEIEKAVQAYRMALTGPDEDTFVLARLAEALDQLGKTDEANEALERAESIDRDSEALWLTRASLAEKHGRIESAIEAYQQAERVAPASIEPPLALATLLNKQGARERARAVLEGFQARSPKSSARAAKAEMALAITEGDVNRSAEVAEAMLRLVPIDIKELCQAVRLALDSEQASIAVKVFEHLPKRACDAELELRFYLKTNQYAAAEQLLFSAQSESFGGLVPTARAYLAIGKPELAERLAQEALVRQPSNEALVIEAECELQQGRLPEAAALFSRVPVGTPYFEEARMGLARVLKAAGLADLAAEVLASVHEPTAAIRSQLAETRLALGDGSGAMSALNSKTNNSTSNAEELRAVFFERVEQIEESRRLWAQLGTTPNNVSALNRERARAERAVADGDLSTAIQALQTQITNVPEDLSARVRLAELQMKAGDIKRASRTAEEVLPMTWEPWLRKRLLAIVPEYGKNPAKANQ
jgi:tetratricopeptide (TPR) repeat protein